MAEVQKDSGRVFNAYEVLAQRLYSALAVAGVNASVSHAEKIATAIRELVEAVVEAQATAGDEDDRTAQYMDHLRSVRG